MYEAATKQARDAVATGETSWRIPTDTRSRSAAAATVLIIEADDLQENLDGGEGFDTILVIGDVLEPLLMYRDEG